jgi:DNA replication protein DnaC
VAGTPTSATSLPAPERDLGPLPEPVPHGQGWLVATKCRWCQADVQLETPGVDDEGQELGRPTELALRIARALVSCDPCAMEHDRNAEAAEAHRLFRGRLSRSGLPADLQALDWSDMDRNGRRRNPIVAARAWSEAAHGKMFLFGPVGTGKTRLAATAAYSRLQHSEVIWLSVPVLFQWAFYDSRSPERQQAQRALASTTPLVLDDLGKEKPGDWARQILFGAIDIRIQAGSPMLITSNFSPDEIAARLGDAVASRLQEFHQYELPGEDRRRPPEDDIPL